MDAPRIKFACFVCLTVILIRKTCAEGLIILVIYFSGTGNSRYAAEAVAGHLKDNLLNANDYIKSSKTADCTSDTPYVFIAPTYAWQIPHIFAKFIKDSHFAGSQVAYYIMSCGDDIGNAGLSLEKLCTEKAMTFMGVSAVIMPENYVALFDVTEKFEAEDLISLADSRLKKLSAEITGGLPFQKEKISFMANMKSRMMNPLFYALFVKAKGFWITDKCIGCGLCEKCCPLNNIKLTTDRPVYGSNCTHCMACICGCPTQAIEYKNRTVGKSRYFNSKSPDISP